jgi:hypothetical protein
MTARIDLAAAAIDVAPLWYHDQGRCPSSFKPTSGLVGISSDDHGLAPTDRKLVPRPGEKDVRL